MTARLTNPRPSPVSSAIAVIAAVGIVLALAENQGAVRQWLLVEVIGLSVLGIGVVGYRTGYRLGGILAGILGAGICAAALGGLLSDIGPLNRLLVVVPAFIGLFALVSGLLPVRGEGSRVMVKLGAGGVFVGVVLAGFFQRASLFLLFVLTIGTVLAWDAGEHAVGVGQQVGRRASTWRLELTHLFGTALVGICGWVLLQVVRRFTSGGLSLTSFALVFVAVVLLTVALR